MPLDLKNMKRIKWQYWVGGIGGAGVVYYMYRRRQANAATASETGAPDPNIDPSTGQPWSSEGYSSATGTTPSAYSYYDPATGQLINAGLAGTTSPQEPGTKIAWTQQAEAYLVSQGWDPLLVSTALGKYLAGLPLTANEENVVNAARAAEGEVPGGAPPIKTVPPPGQSQRLGTPSHLRLQRTAAGTFLYWNAVPNAAGYNVLYNGTFAGRVLTPSAAMHRHGLHAVVAIAPGFKNSFPSTPVVW
jgi:hypothetical protein